MNTRHNAWGENKLGEGGSQDTETEVCKRLAWIYGTRTEFQSGTTENEVGISSDR